jgi:hypothetical protein
MRRWEDNVNMDLGKIDCDDVDWIHMTQVGSSGKLL